MLQVLWLEVVNKNQDTDMSHFVLTAAFILGPVSRFRQ